MKFFPLSYLQIRGILLKRSQIVLIAKILNIVLIVSIIVPTIIIHTINPPGWTDYMEEGVVEALDNFESTGQTNHFEVFMGRDFMPTIGDKFANNLHISVLYCCPEAIQRIWITDGENFSSSPAGVVVYANTYEYYPESGMYWYDGPKWDTKIYVDVVLKISIRYHTLYLVAKHVYIDEVW